MVIPVYGSAPILPELVRRLEAVLAPLAGSDGFDVVLVHDCGPDDAWRVIRELAASRPWLVGLNLRRNAGQHNAIMAGLRHARGRVVVTMDDDLQHDPGDIPALVAKLREGHDVVFARFRRRNHARWKIWGSKLNDVVAQVLLRKPRGLYLSPFRAMVSGVRDQVIRYAGPHAYVDGLLLLATRNVTMVDVDHHDRQDGASGYGLRKSISLWMKMATNFSVAPLRIASWMGILCSAAGMLFAAVLIVTHVMGGETPTGWASLIVTVLMLGGFQLLALGAIGEYVGRIFLSVNAWPQFVVGDTVNAEAAATGEGDRGAS